MNEKDYFIKIKHKYCTVLIQSDKIKFRYNGIIKEVFNDKLIFHDRKVGDIILSFTGLTIIGIRYPTQEEIADMLKNSKVSSNESG